ncbi:glycosyltransferase family 4 protein [Roseospira visakhapatnamensis]|uniref:Glycosyltransferase involved in cell wall biosynthesis n=1 Tax=Roseospira visakhapatnamensis TaxID=390880 RepID=A0A7W6W8V3_9PROT|nr:glycosyltransferase family 4 protein [Roseospira visakhapatnamensis]MBB4265249.1 glycosyltransferase involved in cell wall biosynthesis [Roseospira visakhapatnamensis]
MRHRPHTARVCLVTTEILGVHRTGGIATFASALADLLVAEGHAVTVLCLNGARAMDGPFAPWVETYRRRGLILAPLPDTLPGTPPPGGIWRLGTLGRRLRALDWLAARDFDLIHFNDWGGDAALCGQAKALGLAFADTRLVLGLHGASDWSMAGNDTPLADLSRLAQIDLERAAPAVMDAVWSPSRFMVDRLEGQGVALPPQGARILPLLMPDPGRPRPPEAEATPIDEVVVFGRLEARKGLAWVLDGLDRLATRPPDDRPARVAFLGRAGVLAGEPADRVIRRRAAPWPWETAILDRLHRAEALDHLRQPGRLALIAGAGDNSPLTLHESLALRVPVLARGGGGVAEIVAPEDRARVVIPPETGADALADRLAALIGTMPSPARPRVSREDADTVWRAWHAALLETKPPSRPARTAPAVPLRVLIAPASRPDPVWKTALADGPPDHAAWLLTDADRPDPGAQDRITSLLTLGGADLLAPGWREGPEGRRVLCLDGAPVTAQAVNAVAGPGLVLGPRAVAVAARDWAPESGLWGLVAVAVGAGLTHRAVPATLLSRDRPWIDSPAALARAPAAWAALDTGRSAPLVAGLLAGLVARQAGTHRLDRDIGADPAARAEDRTRRRARALWRAWGWRVTRPLRNRARRRAGLAPEPVDPPPMTEPGAAAEVLWGVLRSRSWALTAAPRLVLKAARNCIHKRSKGLGAGPGDRVPSRPSMQQAGGATHHDSTR